MARKRITISSNKGFGWSFGSEGLKDVTFSTLRGFGWNVEEGEGLPADVVTHGGQPVTHNGEFVTHGA